jgi:hypothetical protein
MENIVNISVIVACFSLTAFFVTAILVKTVGATSLYIANRRLKESGEQLYAKDLRILELETELNNIKHSHYQELQDAMRPEQDDGAYAEDH